MEAIIKEAILKQESALSLFMEDERAFYKNYYFSLTNRIIREKRILEFENPNRVKVCYEYDVVAHPINKKVADEDIIYLFLPDKRKSLQNSEHDHPVSRPKIKCLFRSITTQKR